jgi:CheY-like chemotaxis protein
MSKDEKLRVLLADDDPDIAWGLGKYLTRKGCTVTTCGDGAEAIELLEARPFDAVVTDIQMPKVNGLALVDWAHRYRPAMRVIVITGFGSPSIAEVVKRKGAALYLEKPVDPDIVLQVMTNRASRDSFSGVVDQIDLFDYVQLVTVTRRQTVLDVRSMDGKVGKLYVNCGAICHAECDDLMGEAAFFRCLSFEGGTFTSEPWAEPEKVTITRRADHLLLEAARLKDEGAEAQKPGPVSSFPPAELDFDLDLVMKTVLGDKKE